MKLGVSAFAWTASFLTSHFDLIPQLRDRGFRALEIPIFAPSAIQATPLRRAFESSDMACTICAILPPGINPISPDAATRKRSRAHLSECVETAAELGSHLLAGPLFAPIGYLPGHRPTSDEWEWAVEAFQSLTSLLDQHAITLALEPVNRAETFFLRTTIEAANLCNAIAHPRFGVTIDTFHANIEEKNIPASIELLGPLLSHVHLSENDRSLLGTGHVDFAACLKALERTQYDGYLIIEGFGYSPDDDSGPGALWADLHVSPEDIAYKGYTYLQTLLDS